MSRFRSLPVIVSLTAFLVVQLLQQPDQLLARPKDGADTDEEAPVAALDPDTKVPITGIRLIRGGSCIGIPLFTGLFYYLNQVGQMRRSAPYFIVYNRIRGSEVTDTKMLSQWAIALVNSESPDPCEDFRNHNYIPQAIMIGEYPLQVNMSIAHSNLATNVRTNELGVGAIMTG